MFQHKKSLGQHFLNNIEIVNNIISVANIHNKNVLEIGPGEGILTKELLKNANAVVSVELDNRLINNLNNIKNKYNNFNYIIGNALHLNPLEEPLLTLLNFNNLQKVVVANLPYNVATQIILNYLHLNNYFSYLIVMVQLEVAQRIIATPSTHNYGRLSIIANLLAKCEMLFTVNKENFNPAPKVESAVIKITPYENPLFKVNLDTLKKITNLAFSGKRKTIKNSLKLLDINFNNININPSLRAENLSVLDYCNICNYVDNKTL